MTREEACKILDCSKGTIRRLIKDEKLKPVGRFNLSTPSIAEYLGTTIAEVLSESNAKVEKNESTETPEVSKAKEAATIAEQRAKEAENIQKAISHSLGFKSVEEYLDAAKNLQDKIIEQDTIIAEATKEEREKFEQGQTKARLAEEAYNEKASSYEPENIELRRLCGIQKERIKELEKKLDIQEEEEAKLVDEETYFKENIEKGRACLYSIAKNIAPYHLKLANYLIRQGNELQGMTDPEEGMAKFKACSRSIMNIASYFQENEGNIKGFDADKVCQYLLRRDAVLTKIMRIPDDRKGLPDDDERSKQPEEGTFASQVQTDYGKAMKRFRR